MSQSKFYLRGFLTGEACLENETRHSLKILVRLRDGGNQMFFLPAGESKYVAFENGDRGPTALRAWRVGFPGFFETDIRPGRAYALSPF